MLNTICYFGVFWVMQVTAVLMFTYGGRYPQYRVLMLIIGNAIAIPSIYFLMKLYERMNLNVAYGIGIGGAFLISQVLIAIVFRSPLSPVQWIGVTGMCLGMFLLTQQ